MVTSKISFTGRYIPDQVVTNDDLATVVETNDEWIKSRTGIERRHFSVGENTSVLATKAVQSILEKGVNPNEIDLIIAATLTADFATPSMACMIQNAIGAVNAFAFDLSAACSGFVYGLSVADQFIRSGRIKKALVIGAEVLSKYIDFSDRSTCVIFADGAGAALVEKSDKGGILDYELASDGSKWQGLTAGETRPFNPFYTPEDKTNREHIFMDGRGVLAFVTKEVPKNIRKLLDRNNLSIEDIKYFVPHQANIRIVEALSKKLSIPMEKFYVNIQEYGNTSSASIPIALSEMDDQKMLRKGDKIMLVGFGAGFTWGSMIIEY